MLVNVDICGGNKYFKFNFEDLDEIGLILITYNVKTDEHNFSFAPLLKISQSHLIKQNKPINLFRPAGWHELCWPHIGNFEEKIKKAIKDLIPEVVEELYKRGLK